MFAISSTTAVAARVACARRVGAKKFNPLAAHVARKAPVAKARFSVQANSSSPSPDGEVDLYRDTPLRYMGYSNEVGEAFEAFLPSWGVAATYGVATLYVLADTVDKGKKASDGEPDEDQKLKRGAIVSLDTFTWQMLASVFWPGSFIRCVVNATALGLAVAHVDAEWAKAIPTAAGLAAIPFIVKPIDGTIDLAMEKSVTPALNGKLSGGEIPLAIGILGGCMVVPPTLFTVAAALKDQIPA